MPLKKIFIVILAVPIVAFGFFGFIIVSLFGRVGGESPGDLGNTLAYLSSINDQSAAHRVPPLWAIASVAWESGGEWLATNDNANGTTDAGLGQINSSNWQTYRLSDDPWDVMKNLNAAETILGNALKQYGTIEDALYAYNAGTPENGRRYNPAYVSNVSALYQLILNSDLLVRVSSIDDNVIILTAGEAQYTVHTETTCTTGQDGKESCMTTTWKEHTGEINPSSLSVTLFSKGKTFGPYVASPQSGEDAGLAPEAQVYKVRFPGATLTPQDRMLVTSSGGYSTELMLADLGSPNSVIHHIPPGLAGDKGYSWPLPGYSYISSYFGPRIHPVTHTVSYHEGIDIPANVGTPVIAPKDGTVELTDYNNSVYGYGIYIRHEDGTKTFYGHLESINVMKGWPVKAGDIIGNVGNRGISTGPHLHFGVKINGTWVDPLSNAHIY